MKPMRITIADVARKAGVSAGTVDRVLHNRGEVSPASAQKVRKALDDLKFKPNVFASMLASGQYSVIAALLPSFGEGSYWQQIYDGYCKGAEQMASLNVKLNFFFFDATDVKSFLKACERLMESEPSAVALSPIFKSESLLFTNSLHDKGIPYIYVDTKMEDPNYFAFLGMPMYQSGYLCAALLADGCAPEEMGRVALVGIDRNRRQQSDPTVARREGFNDYMESHYPGCSVLHLNVSGSDSEANYRLLDDFFTAHPDVRKVVMLNSRIHLLGSWLSEHPCKDRRVIGFDCLEKNLDLLRDGFVNVLISQKATEQSCQAVVLLANYLILKKIPERRDFYLHIDILTRFNIENY